MSNLLAQPSFEALAGWTTSGSVIADAAAARSGAKGAVLTPFRIKVGDPLTPAVASQDVSVSAGRWHTVAVFARYVGAAAGAPTLRLYVTDGAAEVTLGTLTRTSTDWTPLVAAYRPVNATVTYTLRGESASGQWHADDALFEETDMAVFLSERAVREVICALQTYLPAELTKITAARGDSLTLPAPDRWFDYEHPEWMADTCQVEVYETAVDFPEPASDASTGGALCTSNVDIAIRITWASRAQATGSTMAAIGRRYATAIRNVLADHAGLFSGLSTIWIDPTGTRIMPAEDYVSPERVRIGARTTYQITIGQREDRSGEDTPGAAALPALVTAVS